MDEMVFRAPVRAGDVVTVRAHVNWAGASSVEVGARVETTRWNHLSEPVHVATAYSCWPPSTITAAPDAPPPWATRSTSAATPRPGYDVSTGSTCAQPSAH